MDNDNIHIVVDSLPYVDQEIDLEDMRAKVDRLVEIEMRKRPKKDISHFPPTFEFFKDSPILATEYQRVLQGKPMEQMDTSRYKLEIPQDTNLEAWKNAVKNSKSQLEHQNLRLVNLELLQKYGANCWRLHNFQLEQELKLLQSSLERYRQEILELNKQRKAEQLQAGRRLEALEAKWTEMIGQTLQVEVACASVANELEHLKQSEQQLRAEKGLSQLDLNDKDENGATSIDQ